MKDTRAYALENKYSDHGVMSISSSADDLVYFVDQDRRGIIVAGKKGMTVLSTQQAIALANELAGIVETMNLRTA